ncbi:KH domain-containing protein [Candidatus Dojkabacteria bacterium]|nr:KH domain-containing protein [Candidatus Dojkabacteria bacterium]
MSKISTKNVETAVKKLLDLLEVEATIDISTEGKGDQACVNVNITSEEGGRLIGYKGQILNSLQFVLTIVQKDNIGDAKLFLDINNYKTEHVEKLKTIAQQAVIQVNDTGLPVDLGPMNPFDRRVIHLEIETIKGVITESIGSEDDYIKRIVVKSGKK